MVGVRVTDLGEEGSDGQAGLGGLYEVGFVEVGSGGLVEERAARTGSVSS
jgi:hypothetical protein